ncbi:hypothetical protein QBC38DRAFT_269772 [Podospora fimiseda]|uniref:RNase H type-1 domain-containing protein n=1 Tax=Podospora fimiseda TaxID=252190 RepID=A0AAN7H0R4_9PEZI|nr:hypothetical protein QBC38DRAFT_269772 [Podospora fimiseda]
MHIGRRVPWLFCGWGLGGVASSNHGELIAVAEALWIACGHAQQAQLELGTVKIFTDSKATLILLTECSRGDIYCELDDEARPVLGLVLWLAFCLVKNYKCRLEMHWIPGHEHTFLPHCIADKLARDFWKNSTDARRYHGVTTCTRGGYRLQGSTPKGSLTG